MAFSLWDGDSTASCLVARPVSFQFKLAPCKPPTKAADLRRITTRVGHVFGQVEPEQVPQVGSLGLIGLFIDPEMSTTRTMSAALRTALPAHCRVGIEELLSVRLPHQGTRAALAGVEIAALHACDRRCWTAPGR